MNTYRVTRTITVKVYDYIEAENQEDAQVKVNSMRPLLNEVADAVSNRHVSVLYDDYVETVEEA